MGPRRVGEEDAFFSPTFGVAELSLQWGLAG